MVFLALEGDGGGDAEFFEETGEEGRGFFLPLFDVNGDDGIALLVHDLAEGF